ncbi:hypothetical protein [Sphingomonas bacterium]|uniref:hypothetical protein n=1 Tax=Sphingomonas bacterium TaxID=1895847 RepID=UPI0015767832|nr:hypothetical protein [Sphingomonas bacterium]
MSEAETFAAHASRCRAEADAATLDNVRDRALRAEAAWAIMAERSRKTQASRDAKQARALTDAAPATFPPER